MTADHVETTDRTRTEDRTTDRWVNRPAALAALVVGGVLTLIGVLAPLVAGQRGEFLGFGRNYLHDVIHLGSGLAGLAAGYVAGGKFAREYDLAVGGVYLLVTVLGLVAFGLLADLIALNAADNALHALLAIVLLAVGYFYGDRERGT